MAWNIEELKKIRYEHFQIMDSINNAEMIEDAEKYIRYLDEMIDLLNYYDGEDVDEEEVTDNHSTPYSTIVKNDSRLLRDYVTYTPFADVLARYKNKISLPSITLPEKKIETTDILVTTDEFYSQLGGELYTAYRSLSDTYETRLQFFELIEGCTTLGQTFFFPFTNDIFIEVGCGDTISDYSTTIHESGHGIASILNPFIGVDYEKYGFSEVESIFLEMIGDDFVGKKLGKRREMLMKTLDDLKDYIRFAYRFSAKKKMYSELSKKEYKKKSIARKYIQSITGAKIANQAIDTEMADDIQYIISYLTAVELYMMYQENPDNAIETFYDIIMCSDMDVNGYMYTVQSFGIIPGAHLDKYIALLIDRDRELSNKRLIRRI